MKKPKNKKKESKKYLIAYAFIFVIMLYLVLQMGQIPGDNVFNAFISVFDRIKEHPLGIFPISTKYFLVGVYVYFIVVASLHVEYLRKKDLRPGEESGSASWNEDIKAFNLKYVELIKWFLPKFLFKLPLIGKTMSKLEAKLNKMFPRVNQKPSFDNKNMILSNEVFLSMNTRKTRLNNNILIIGGSGTGKSRFFIKPNMLQENCSYVITDPSGELLNTQGKFLESRGYKIKVFNLVQMDHSNSYNPFHYIRNEEGVLTMINALIKNTTPKGQSSGDPFWEKSETALLQAICFYLQSECNMEDRNFTNVMKLLRCAEVKEDQGDYESTLDIMFKNLKERDPEHMAVRSYAIFKQAAGKTAQSILVSCSVRLQVFNMEAITRLTSVDNINLEKIGDEKTALFCITPVVDTTFNFLVALLYTQLFETLYFHAETECKGMRLPVHVRFLLDEFANIGTIPEFTQKVSTMRKYEISVSIVIQALSQLKAMYEKDWEVLVGNCDEQVFLGGSDATTLDYMSKKLGKETIKSLNSSRSFGKQGSNSLSYNTTGRELLTPDELSQMDNNNCIVFIRGEAPFFTTKYDLERHPNYKFTGDAHDKYLYDVKEGFKTKTKEETKSMNEPVGYRVQVMAEKTDTFNINREMRRSQKPTPKTTHMSAPLNTPLNSAEAIEAVTRQKLTGNETPEECNKLFEEHLDHESGHFQLDEFAQGHSNYAGGK